MHHGKKVLLKIQEFKGTLSREKFAKQVYFFRGKSHIEFEAGPGQGCEP
jgi:hypothetical protein